MIPELGDLSRELSSFDPPELFKVRYIQRVYVYRKTGEVVFGKGGFGDENLYWLGTFDPGIYLRLSPSIFMDSTGRIQHMADMGW